MAYSIYLFKGEVHPICFMIALGRGPKVETDSIFFLSKVLSIGQSKLGLEPILRTMGASETSCTREPQHCHLLSAEMQVGALAASCTKHLLSAQ